MLLILTLGFILLHTVVAVASIETRSLFLNISNIRKSSSISVVSNSISCLHYIATSINRIPIFSDLIQFEDGSSIRTRDLFEVTVEDRNSIGSFGNSSVLARSRKTCEQIQGLLHEKAVNIPTLYVPYQSIEKHCSVLAAQGCPNIKLFLQNNRSSESSAMLKWDFISSSHVYISSKANMDFIEKIDARDIMHFSSQTTHSNVFVWKDVLTHQLVYKIQYGIISLSHLTVHVLPDYANIFVKNHFNCTEITCPLLAQSYIWQIENNTDALISEDTIMNLLREKSEIKVHAHWSHRPQIRLNTNQQLSMQFEQKENLNLAIKLHEEDELVLRYFKSSESRSKFDVYALLLIESTIANNGDNLKCIYRGNTADMYWIQNRNRIDDTRANPMGTLVVYCAFQKGLPSNGSQNSIELHFQSKSMTRNTIKDTVVECIVRSPMVRRQNDEYISTLCIPTLFTENKSNVNTNWIVQHILHYHNVFDVNHVNIYSDNPKSMKALQTLSKTSRLRDKNIKILITDLSNKQSQLSQMHYHGQTYATSACWLQNRAALTNWTFFVDFDEVLNWPAQWKNVRWNDKFYGFSSISFGSWEYLYDSCGFDDVSNQGVTENAISLLQSSLSQSHLLSMYSDKVQKSSQTLTADIRYDNLASRLLFTNSARPYCFKRTKSCKAMAINCCLYNCGRRKFALVTHRAAPYTIHAPIVDGYDLRLDVRTGVYLKHLRGIVVAPSESICMNMVNISSLLEREKPPVLSNKDGEESEETLLRITYDAFNAINEKCGIFNQE